MKLWRKALGEFIGTAGLLIVVVGSGIMGESLANGNAAIALLANSVATGAGLVALIFTFREISGSHFNPVVSLVEFFLNRLGKSDFAVYVLAQVAGAVVGVWLTHFMFGQQILQLSIKDRGELRFYVSELIATFGLVFVILRAGRKNSDVIPFAVAAYITAAYWCTSSTSFANPAVTIARSLTDTFSGILWTGAGWFIIAQVFGGVAALILSKIMVE